ncbi:MAG: Dam family site-specific DNA-(adenine-N6)-methyltransferase [Acidobacteriota bacterium]
MPTVEAQPAVRPPLKWAGGKRWQVPHLLPLWTAHSRSRLIEPFCGGLAVALGLSPNRALLNDANPHLINFYRWLQKGLATDLNMENDERLFYRHRARFNELVANGQEDTPEGAALFYYLNRTGYNGLCRFNSKGGFNVPFGSYKRIAYTHDFTVYRDAFEDWDFSTGDFEALKLEPTDFVYADPPYDVEFTSYSKGGFSWEDQVRAAQWLSRHKGPVILVNQATPRIEELYRTLGYAVRFLDAPRRISCNGNRTPAKEILGTRNL